MATKYKIYVNPNNQAQQNNAQLVQQLAQNAAQQQLQQQTPQPEDLKQTVTELIRKNIITPVELPKYTTIQDVFNAPKGEKLNKLADFMNNPETMRTIGDLMPFYGYDPKTGRGNNIMEDAAKRKEALFEIDRQNAINQMKQQNEILGDAYRGIVQGDIAEMQDKRQRELAEMEMKWKEKENALDRELRRQENAENRAQRLELAKIIHGGATGQAAGINGLKMTAAERKSYTDGKTTLANIESGLKALEKNPKAYTFAKGILPSDITNRIDPKGVATRTQIDNITAVYRKWLTGAQMSDKERKAYERFLPAPTDNYNIVKAKLNGMKGAIERSNDAILSNYGVSSDSMNGVTDSLGLGI